MFPLSHPEADKELEEAAFYYENCSRGLGVDFINDYAENLHRILESPEVYAFYFQNTRRVTLDKFPYAIVYEILQKHVYILAVMHLRRKPYYWIDRI